MTDEPIQIGTKLRDAAVDPQPGDFMPMIEVRGNTGVFRHMQVDEPGFAAAVDEHKAAIAEDQEDENNG